MMALWIFLPLPLIQLEEIEMRNVSIINRGSFANTVPPATLSAAPGEDAT